MKLCVKNGFATPINPYTDKDQRKAFAKKFPKYRVYEADGETPFDDVREIDANEFSKVFKAGVQKSILVFKQQRGLSTDQKLVSLKRFTESIANMELGCAPSAGYMQEIIESARKVLTTINQ